jgi:hypothetical protein
MYLSVTRTIAILLLLTLESVNAAHAALFSTNGLDPAFCNMKTVRQTVVYVDDMMMVDGSTDWAMKVNAKLKASLVPGERVTVVRLSPGTARSDEIWTGCWPEYTAEQRTQFAKETYLISRNPLDTIGDQQKFFTVAFGGALARIYADAKRPAAAVHFSVSKPPQKQILRALASDEGRFGASPTTIRAIVYSDMMENSDLASVFKPPSTVPNYSDKLGSHLRRSVFYAYGVAEDVTDGQSVQETAKAFWGSALKMLSSTLEGFGTDLNVPNQVPVTAYFYNAQLNVNGTILDGNMSLLTDVDGYLVDSWIGFSRLSISGLTGTFRCRSGNCQLDGATNSELITNNPTEVVRLTGPTNKLEGNLGIEGKDAHGQSALFELKAVLPN